MWRILSTFIAVATVGVLAVANILHAAETGTDTGGMAGFHGQGNFQEFAPDFGLWTGEFWGESTTDSGRGPMHRGGWYCTGEQAFQGGVTKWGGGFCTITDVDGADIGTRGDYYSGTGKYEGITGWYTFDCDNVAISHFFCEITGGEYNIP